MVELVVVAAVHPTVVVRVVIVVLHRDGRWRRRKRGFPDWDEPKNLARKIQTGSVKNKTERGS